jgi:hypothetical protein
MGPGPTKKVTVEYFLIDNLIAMSFVHGVLFSALYSSSIANVHKYCFGCNKK